jgi:hypothetical protein
VKITKDYEGIERLENIKRTTLGGKVEFTPELYVGGIGNEI